MPNLYEQARQFRVDLIKRELIQMQEFARLTAGHPIMELQFLQRVEELKGELLTQCRTSTISLDSSDPNS